MEPTTPITIKPVIGDDFGGGGILTNQSTIEGTGVIASGTQGLINSGTINANVPVGTAGLLLNICCEGSSGIVNSGTIEASNGGLVQFLPYNSFSNTGTLTAAAKSTINITNNAPFTNLSNGTLTGGHLQRHRNPPDSREHHDQRRQDHTHRKGIADTESQHQRSGRLSHQCLQGQL